MQIKVEIKYELWPYEETMAVNIPAESFSNMDTYVDSMVSNLKMRLLTHVKMYHPNTWYPNTTVDLEQLKKLTHVDAS